VTLRKRVRTAYGHVSCSTLRQREFNMRYGYGFGGIVVIVLVILFLTGRL
jgi:hypothetical protein